ncbi:hypothetical protein GGP87_003133 [Salinibacter ruber]|nr:hypothetical protein [Salinibacter ruber]
MSTSRVWFVLALFSLSILISCDSGGGTPEPDEPSEVSVDVTGTVTSAGADGPIGGASVEVLRADNGNTLASATTDTTGSYEATFTIEEPSAPDQIRLALSAEGFVDKEVSTGFQPSVSEDVALEVMSVEATASGTVTDSDAGDPIEGASVTGTRPDGGEQLFEATTSSDGTYDVTFEVADEPSEVEIAASADGFEMGSKTVSFSEEIAADFGLPPSTTQATASGTVTDEDTGDPIEGANVTGTRPDGGDQLFQATTSSDGTYEATFGVADEPSEITVQAEAENFDSGERSASFGEQITADVSLQPATIEATASGTVSRSDSGDPIEGATVTGTRAGSGDKLFEATTSSDGSYQASYSVKATNEPSDVDFAVSAGDFKSGGATVAFSEEIARDFQLEPKTTEATVSGTVTRSDNSDPIDGVTVTGSPAGGSEKLFETTTNASGEYETTFEVKVPDEPDQISVAANLGDYDGSEKTVDFGSAITADFGLSPSEVNVTIDGTITAKLDGSTVEGAEVSAFRPNVSGALANTTSEMGGAYSLSFTVLAPDAPAELRLEASESRFDEATLTVGFSESVSQGIALPSIEISSIEELQAIQTDSNFPIDGFYVQTSDIDASKTASWNGGKGFEPIGDDAISFTGAFNGNSFAIENLTVHRGEEDLVSLFGAVGEGGAVRNVVLQGVSIIEETSVLGSSSVGGLAGSNVGRISNCEVSGEVNGRINTGGLVGTNRGVISSSRASVTVSGVVETGGLVGENSSGVGTGIEGSIQNSIATGNVAGVNKTGGLVGDNFQTVEASVATGSVSGEVGNSESVGGLIGIINGSSNVISSYATGDVSGASEVGGLAGTNISGIEISESYASGLVSGDEDVGGIIGLNGTDGANLNALYWDTEASGQSSGVGRGDATGTTGLTTSEMQGNSAEENMGGFDFQNTWRVVMGDYPALQWEE